MVRLAQAPGSAPQNPPTSRHRGTNNRRTCALAPSANCDLSEQFHLPKQDLSVKKKDNKSCGLFHAACERLTPLQKTRCPQPGDALTCETMQSETAPPPFHPMSGRKCVHGWNCTSASERPKLPPASKPCPCSRHASSLQFTIKRRAVRTAKTGYAMHAKNPRADFLEDKKQTTSPSPVVLSAPFGRNSPETLQLHFLPKTKRTRLSSIQLQRSPNVHALDPETQCCLPQTPVVIALPSAAALLENHCSCRQTLAVGHSSTATPSGGDWTNPQRGRAVCHVTAETCCSAAILSSSKAWAPEGGCV